MASHEEHEENRDSQSKIVVILIADDSCERPTATSAAAMGQCRVGRLIEHYGLDGKINQWSDEVTADCPRKQINNMSDPCCAIGPNLQNAVRQSA
jgi:hypothetical protein